MALTYKYDIKLSNITVYASIETMNGYACVFFIKGKVFS